MTTIFKDKRIPVNHVELQVRQYEGAGAAIVFLHFSGANLMMWSRAMHHFQESHRLVLVDLRGHGRSDSPAHGYGADNMAKDVLEVMTALGIEKAHVIGSSMGAEVGLSLAANHPERVISLACDGAFASEYGPYGTWNGSEKEFEDHVTEALKKMAERPERIYSSVDELVNFHRENLEPVGWWNADVELMVRYGVKDLGDGRVTSSPDRTVLLEYMESYYPMRLEEYYSWVTCPILMLPEEELLTNEREIACMHALQGLAKEARIVPVQGWQHPYGWLIDPYAMCMTLREFLGQCEQGLLAEFK